MAEADVNVWQGRGLRLFVGILFLLMAVPFWVAADEVLLKNGQRLNSPKAWVDGEYAHFILQGTADVEIRYALEIVDRILTAEGKQIYPQAASGGDTSAEKTIEPAAPVTALAPETVPQKAPDAPQRKTSPKPEPAPKSSVSVSAVPSEELQAPGNIDIKLLRARAKKLRDVPFYDPHRKQKYWAASQSRHTDINSAVAALADLFERTPAWVTTHMGNTNDLSQIHLNLIRQLEKWNQPPSPSTATAKDVKAAEKPPVKTPAPQSPSKKHAAEPTKASPKAVRASNPFASNLPDTQGPMFYNPRRPKKFWANETSRHSSLDAALNALADQYGQSVAWIETHMGESNSLQEIHQALTQASQKENE
jgi:hypothetical protein